MSFAQPKDAAAAFERVVSGELQYAVSHKTLGIVYDRTGRYAAAVAPYRAHRAHPEPGVGTDESRQYPPPAW